MRIHTGAPATRLSFAAALSLASGVAALACMQTSGWLALFFGAAAVGLALGSRERLRSDASLVGSRLSLAGLCLGALAILLIAPTLVLGFIHLLHA